MPKLGKICAIGIFISGNALKINMIAMGTQLPIGLEESMIHDAKNRTIDGWEYRCAAIERQRNTGAH